MIHTAHIYLHHIARYLYGRDMLLLAGLHGARDQFVHFITAAVQRDIGIVNHLGDIAAVGADVKLALFHNLFLRIFVFCFMALL
jgi:hypothetical protein